MLPAGGPSPAHTCGTVLVAAVLLQSVCVAVTYIYFTNELKQVGAAGPGEELLLFVFFFPHKSYFFLGGGLVCVLLSHGVCKRLSRAELRERPTPHRMSRRQWERARQKLEGGGEGGDPFKSLVQHRAEPAGTERPPAAGSQRCAASRQPFLRCSVLAPSPHVRRPLHGGTPRCLRWGVGALEGREMFLLLAGPCLMTAPRSRADFISFTCKMLRMQTYINIRVQLRALLSLSFPLHKAQHPAPEFCTGPRLH